MRARAGGHKAFMTLRELLALSDEELHALTPEDILGTSDRNRRTIPAPRPLPERETMTGRRLHLLPQPD
jgi:hypothetical protein